MKSPVALFINIDPPILQVQCYNNDVAQDLIIPHLTILANNLGVNIKPNPNLPSRIQYGQSPDYYPNNALITETTDDKFGVSVNPVDGIFYIKVDKNQKLARAIFDSFSLGEVGGTIIETQTDNYIYFTPVQYEGGPLSTIYDDAVVLGAIGDNPPSSSL